MFTILADSYMTAARIEPMIGRRHPDSIRISLMAAEQEARKARIAEMLREDEARARRAAMRRLVARAFGAAGAGLSGIGARIAPREATC